VISTNVTVLADDIESEENLTMSEIPHYAIGPNNEKMFLARIFSKKLRCGDFFIFTKYVSR